MLSTVLCEELEIGVVPEFDSLEDPEIDDAVENTDADQEDESAPPWEQIFGDNALTLVADGRKSSDDDEDPDLDEFDEDLGDDEDFDDEDFDEEDDELEEDFDDFEFDEEEEEEEDL